MTNKIASRPDHLEPIADEQGVPRAPFQLFFDDLFRAANAIFGDSFIMNAYTVAQLEGEDATVLAKNNLNGAVIVTNEKDGRTIATSDGTNWKRVSDGATISPPPPSP